MMPLRRFEIHQPSSVSEAAKMLAQFGDDGTRYAGGTELLLAMKHDVLRYRDLVDLKVIPGFASIDFVTGELCIGAGATHRSIERSELVRSRLPMFARMESRVANVRVRSTGTLGGNLCFAEPHSDPATLLLALEAKVVAEGANGRREMPISELIVGAYEISLQPDEVLTSVNIPVGGPERRAAYVKFQVHERPTLGLALVLDTSDAGKSFTRARVAIGCVSPFSRRSEKAESLLLGARREVERHLPEAAEALADAAELVDDHEGSAEYKRNLIGVFFRRAFLEALDGAGHGH